MIRTRIELVVGPETPLGSISRSHPDATLEPLTVRRGVDGTMLALEVSTPDLAAVTGGLVTHPDTEEVSVVHETAESAFVTVAGESTTLVDLLLRTGIAADGSVAIRDGTATVTLWRDPAGFDALRERLDDAGIEVDSVETVGGLLTETQLSLLQAAMEAGYYDVPRRCTLTELAEEYGVAKSTASETLHRAESRVVRWFADGGVTHEAGASLVEAE